MMNSSEAYYEKSLEGKDEKQLLSTIRGLKNEIGHLKKVMEHPDYKNKDKTDSKERIRLDCAREFLIHAIRAVEENGDQYQPSKAELKAREFQDKLKHLSKITFEIGGFFDGVTKYIIEIQDDIAFCISSKFDCILQKRIIDKKEIIDALSKLYIGEWRRRYDPLRFGYGVLDGTQWDISFEYSDRNKTEEFAGSNDYPYNFYELLEIFGIQPDMLNEEDEEWGECDD